jgi:hypothetical protein
MNLNPTAETVMRIILESGIEAAERHVREHLLIAVERARAELERAQANLNAASSVIQFAKPTTASVDVEAPTPEAPVDESTAKRSLILNAAEDVGARSEIVTTEDVLAELRRNGVVMPGARPGTAVGNVMNRSGAWARIGEGKFRRAAAA